MNLGSGENALTGKTIIQIENVLMNPCSRRALLIGSQRYSPHTKNWAERWDLDLLQIDKFCGNWKFWLTMHLFVAFFSPKSNWRARHILSRANLFSGNKSDFVSQKYASFSCNYRFVLWSRFFFSVGKARLKSYRAGHKILSKLL